MLKLNKDVLYLILQELRDDKKALHSCLSINKTWCEIIVPILWKDPWKYLKEGKEKLLLSIIISHLSDTSKNDFCQDIDFLTNSNMRPLFNYISFCRHLNLNEIESIVYAISFKLSKFPIIKDEIFNLFINENTKITHIYIPYKFNYQIHNISGSERCFSKLEFFCCDTSVSEDVLVGLANICKSIKSLELSVTTYGNNGIIKLIEAQKNLNDVFLQSSVERKYESFCIILEDSLIKHADTIQYLKITKQPITKILSSLVNLKSLELDDSSYVAWNCLEKLTLPFLQILRASRVPVKVLTSLIENTSGHLTEIKIDYIFHDEINNKRIIQAIYQNCPNLQYLELALRDCNILELEKLLINCQYLKGLYILIDNTIDVFGFGNLFEILTRSSPSSLFKFKFELYFEDGKLLTLESLKLFFDNWKGRHPMFLQTIWFCRKHTSDIADLIEKYKAEGVIRKYDNILYGEDFEDFEWVQNSSKIRRPKLYHLIN